EAHLVRVAERRCGDRAAQVDVDATPDALRVGLREAGEPGVDAALHEAFCLYGIESGLRLNGAGEEGNEQELHEASRKSLTILIWSVCSRVGAWPTPGISTTFAFGPRRAMPSTVVFNSRSDCAPRKTSVGQRIAS